MATKKIQAEKRAKRQWKSEEEEILISQWSKYDCLFNTSSEEFKRTDKKQAARDAIRKMLEEETGSCFTDEDIKSKMRNLRTHYGKELGKTRASKATGTGTKDVYVPTWKWFKMLGFLSDSITPIKTRPTPGVQIPIDDENEENINEHLQEFSEKEDYADTPLDASSDAGDMLASRKSVNRSSKSSVKTDLESKLLERSMSVLEDIGKKRVSSTEEDGDSLFAKHVCHTLKEIKTKQAKEMVKLKIQQLLFEAQFCNNSQATQPNVWELPFPSSFAQL